LAAGTGDGVKEERKQALLFENMAIARGDREIKKLLSVFYPA
jgi:hypothetical protein